MSQEAPRLRNRPGWDRARAGPISGNKANKGIPLNEEEALIRRMISHTWYFNHGQMYEQAVHLDDERLIKSRISLPQRFVPLFPGIKADWLSVKDEYISKGYEALVEPYEKAFQKLDQSKRP